jgi:hypothetical protein
MAPVVLSIRTNSKIVRQGLEHLRKTIPTVGRKRLYEAAVEVRRRMKKPGKVAPAYPPAWVHWDSAKQKRAFFRTDGFGGGIPHRRTGKYESSWVVSKLPDGYSVGSTMKQAKYIGGGVYGGSQSNIHQGRWPVFRTQMDIVVRRLPKLVKRDMKSVVSQSLLRGNSEGVK